MRKPAEIAAEIAKLEKMKPTVRQFSIFGDDHHAAIDAQIDALMERMDNDEIFDKEEDGEWSASVREQAEYAIQWMNGEKGQAAPSEEWKDLVIEA